MENKDRKLLQNIADKMKEIDQDIWIKYVLAPCNSTPSNPSDLINSDKYCVGK